MPKQVYKFIKLSFFETLTVFILLPRHPCQLLQAKRNHRISEELVLDILENYFTSKEAQRQLRTAMDWGRYAELFSYDEPSGEIFIEESSEDIATESEMSDSSSL